jgi:hypothetical protein
MSAKVIRSADPKARVVLAGLGPGRAKNRQIYSARFLNQVYRAGGKPFFDVVADHPYAANVRDMAELLKDAAAVMRGHHDDAPLWVDELGWASGRLPNYPLTVGPRGQARLLKASFHYILRHRGSLHIRRLLWFDWRDPGYVGLHCHGCFDFGLVRSDRRRKYAYRAYRAIAK